MSIPPSNRGGVTTSSEAVKNPTTHSKYPPHGGNLSSEFLFHWFIVLCLQITWLRSKDWHPVGAQTGIPGGITCRLDWISMSYGNKDLYEPTSIQGLYLNLAKMRTVSDSTAKSGMSLIADCYELARISMECHNGFCCRCSVQLECFLDQLFFDGSQTNFVKHAMKVAGLFSENFQITKSR